MSPLCRTENGWKIDRTALLTWIITLIMGAIIAVPGTYYGVKYMVADHERRIIATEEIAKIHEAKIGNFERYIATDTVRTEWMCQDIKDIKALVTEIRLEQKRIGKRGE